MKKQERKKEKERLYRREQEMRVKAQWTNTNAYKRFCGKIYTHTQKCANAINVKIENKTNGMNKMQNTYTQKLILRKHLHRIEFDSCLFRLRCRVNRVYAWHSLTFILLIAHRCSQLTFGMLSLWISNDNYHQFSTAFKFIFSHSFLFRCFFFQIGFQ